MPRPAPVARACPTCGRAFVRLELHTVCPLAPDVHAWLVQNLPDPADPRYIIQARGLDGRDVPITRAVLMRHYGTWRNLAAAFGLRCRTRAHGDRAQLGPDEYAELHRLAQELHGGKHGPSHGEYGVFARPARSPEQQRMTAKQREDAAIADVAQMDAAVRAVLAGEFDRGLTVMDPHPAKGGGTGYWIR